MRQKKQEIHISLVRSMNIRIPSKSLMEPRSALWVVANGRYTTSTGSVSTSGETKTYNMAVTSSDTLMRIAVAYSNQVQFTSSNHTSTSGLGGTIAELKIEVYSPNNTFVEEAFCNTPGANLKVVEFDPRLYGTGTYKIKIIQTSATISGRSTLFGVAWR